MKARTLSRRNRTPPGPLGGRVEPGHDGGGVGAYLWQLGNARAQKAWSSQANSIATWNAPAWWP